MSRIVLDVDNAHLSTLLLFLKTLDYLEVKSVEKDIPAEQADPEKLTKLFSLYGAWDDERSAEEIVEEIQQSRVFNRSIESL